MEKIFDMSAPILAATSNMIQNLLEYIPQLLGALLLLIFGWFVARILRAATIRVGQSVGRLSGVLKLNDSFFKNDLNKLILPILGNVVFWLVILFFIASSTNILGLTLFSGWLDQVIGHLPKILSGALIIFAGLIFGNLVADAVRAATHSMPIRQRTLLVQAAQIFTFATMIIIGIDQIGIDITVLITVLAIAFGAFLGGVAIAFSLGSKTLVSNLIGVHYLNKEYRIGENVKVGNSEGTILEITPVAIVLESDEGKITIPAKLFNEEVSMLLNREAPNAR